MKNQRLDRSQRPASDVATQPPVHGSAASLRATIQEIADRWIHKFSVPITTALLGLRPRVAVGPIVLT